MRRQALQIGTTAVLLASLLVGCESTPKTETPEDTASANPPQQPAGDPQLTALMARLDALEEDNVALRRELGARERAEIEARRLLQQERAANPGSDPAEPEAGITPNQPATVNPGTPATQQGARSAAVVDLNEASPDELLEALLTRLGESSDGDRVRALKAAALSMLSRRHDLDYALLDALGPADREQVVRFHQLMAITFDEIAAGTQGELTRRDMLDKINEVFGDQPLQIAAVELCRRVDGYGIFTPLPTHRFVTGRRNALNGGTVHDAVLYLELENFVRRELADGTFEVKVSWELALYDRAGDVVLWRQPPAVVTDVSRNQRRDFFLAQTIDLPPNLQGGGYLLEVRVIDQNSGARHEQTIRDIEFVADRNLVGG